MFFDNDNIVALLIGDGVSSLGSYLFCKCDGFKYISIPSSVTSIPSSVFYTTYSWKNYSFYDSNNNYLNTSAEELSGYRYESIGGLSFVRIDNTSGTCGDDLRYSLDSYGTLLITGKGDMYDYHKYGAPWYPNDNIKEVIIGSEVTHIGNNAFYDNSTITSVTINGAASIGTQAFAKCDSLKTVTLKNGCPSIGVSAFYDCDSLNTIMLPDSVVYIGDNAFYDCDSLRTVTIGNGGVTIWNKAFYDCDAITSVTINGGPVSIKDEVFSSCDALATVSIGDGATSIGDNAFYLCTNLSSLTIPSTIVYIGAGAFFRCLSISSISFPEALDYLGDFAFYPIEFYDGDILLEHTIGDLAGKRFQGSEGVLCTGPNTTISIGDSFIENGLEYTVLSFEPNVLQVTGFEGRIKGVSIPNVLSYDGTEFIILSIGKQAFYGCTTLTSVDLGAVTEIGVKAFANCTKLKTVNIGDSLKTISAYAFYRCANLTETGLEDSAKTLRSFGSYSFYKCPKLSSVAVPSFMTTIGSHAFSFLFEDENGSSLDVSVESLRGYVYALSDGKMVRQPGISVGTEFQFGGLNYVTTASLPAEAEVAGYNVVSKSLTVPSEVFCGDVACAVTGIGENAFKGCAVLRTVDLGEVERIGKQAFYGCSRLSSVFGDDVRSIGVKAFAYCAALSNIGFGDDLKTVSAYAFCKCKSLELFDASDSLRTIGSYAFYKCSSMEEAHSGQSLRNIGSHAFASCPDLEYIDFPDSLKKVGSKAFSGLTFQDSDGNIVSQTAKALRGHAFVGSDGVLVLAS